MGQKINPISFRSNEALQIQNNKWVVNPNNNKYTNLIHQDFEIQRFLMDFLNLKKIYVNKIYISRFNNQIKIDIQCFYFLNKKVLNNINKIKLYLHFLLKYYLNLNNNTILNINLINLNNKKLIKKNFKFIKKNKFKYRRINKISLIFYLMIICFNYKSSNILALYISNLLQNSTNKKQFQQINFIKNICKDFFNHYKNSLIGLKIYIKGRLNSSKRSKKIVINYGQTPLQTLNVKVNYSLNNFVTKDGTYGVKIWFFYK